jgi:hypothetical protein
MLYTHSISCDHPQHHQNQGSTIPKYIYTESRTVGSSLDVSVDEEERNIESEYSEHLPRWAIIPSYINIFKGPNVIQPQS